MLEEIRNLLDAVVAFASLEDCGEVKRLSHTLIQRAQYMRDDAYAAGLRDSKDYESVYRAPQVDSVETVYRRPRKRR